VGCIPTKALLHAAEVADAPASPSSSASGRRSTASTWPASTPTRTASSPAVQGAHRLIKGRGITVIEGSGRLTGPTTVDGGRRVVRRQHVVLASGSYSRSLPGLDVDGERVITSEHALRLDRVPASVDRARRRRHRLEFASVWRSFGAEVTIVEALPRLVAAEDEASSKVLEARFRKRGIAFRTGTPFRA
jgi:dihydrolipoamide dehydrogenase